MEIALIILGVLLGIMLIALLGLYAKFRRNGSNPQDQVEIKKLKEANNQLMQEKKELIWTKQELNSTAKRLTDENTRLAAKNDELAVSLQKSLSNNANADESLNERSKALSDEIRQKDEKKAQLDESIHNRTQELNDVAAQLKELIDKLTEAQAQNAAAASVLDGYKKELEEINRQLSDAKETKRAETLSEFQIKEDWFDFELSEKERRLSEIIKEVSALYPDLGKEFAKIEWTKVWMPKFQQLAATQNLEARGIYRLVLKGDERICYVGQAANIKNRWYDHAKKMLGADVKGNEKVYNYRPEDFYWTVVERNTVDLNKSERYWIEYYACKEVGLNKKL